MSELSIRLVIFAFGFIAGGAIALFAVAWNKYKGIEYSLDDEGEQ